MGSSLSKEIREYAQLAWERMLHHRFSRGYIGLQAGEEARPFRWLLTYSAITESGAPPHDAAK